MGHPLKIVYSYNFKNGTTKKFDVNLDRQTLAFIPGERIDPPLWALLNNKKCARCPLDVTAHTYCPVALNFADIAEQFRDMVSHENVNVTVATEERVYSKDTTVQQGLSPLVGIIMTTSGCPIMERLKPMVRFHLPFATLEETIFRMASMYLMAQYFQKQNGKTVEWNLDGLAKVYAEVGVVNRGFAQRLRDAAKKDANVNALVNLDCFATMVPLAAEETLSQIKLHFSAYL